MQDSRPLRHIPLTSVLDALDFESGESSSDADDSDDNPSIASSVPTRQFSQLGKSGRSKDGHSSSAAERTQTSASDDHTFRIVTAKRTIVLCAPSEEDEIKWLAAFRALLNRERWGAVASGSSVMSSGASGMEAGTSVGSAAGRVAVPFITAQPPTPASQVSSGGDAPPTPSVSTSQGAPVWERDRREEWQTQTSGLPGLRGRSATFNAKSAVADVVRRYHPDQQGGSAVQT